MRAIKRIIWVSYQIYGKPKITLIDYASKVIWKGSRFNGKLFFLVGHLLISNMVVWLAVFWKYFWIC